MDIISTYGVGYYGQARYNSVYIYEDLNASLVVSTFARTNKSPIIIKTINNKPLIETPPRWVFPEDIEAFILQYG